MNAQIACGEEEKNKKVIDEIYSVSIRFIAYR